MRQMICTESFMWNMGDFVYAGQVYYDESPLVRKFPMFFRPVEFADDGRMMVEQATAGPGEQRNALRKPAPEPEVEPVAEPEAVRSGRPWTTASKDEWLTYAASIGVDGTGMTKHELIDAVDERERLTVGD